MKKNIRTSFIKLIGASGQQGDIHDKIIIIPEVQRDFAFGRIDKKSTEKRIGFIDSIFETLESNKELPMTFVYGALDDDRFSPLDGQQRLSILFLLHWYFCPKDQIGIFKKGDQSRFVYEVRQFAKDFCRRIVDHSANDIIAKKDVVKKFFIERIDASSLPEKKKEDQKKNLKIKLSDIIKNENWFIDSWTSDPTVSGMLVFLDAIHEKAIKDSTNRDVVWQKLISSDPPIYFDILVLDELTKPNELYVKMNSRGRELSEFDNFKSMMEGELQAMKPDGFDGDNKREKENNKADFIKNWTADIDNVWINVFWRYFVDKDKIDGDKMKDMNNIKKPKFLKGIVGNVEDYYLKFFGLIMQFYIITRDGQTFNLKYTEITEESINDLSSLKRYAGKNNILNLVYQLKRAGFFTFDFFKYFRNCADALFYKDRSEDYEGTDLSKKTMSTDGSLLKKILESKSPTYVDRVMFFGLLCFLRMKSNASQVFITPDEFKEWERVVYNLCNNSKIDDYNPYYNALNGIEALCKDVYDPGKANDILDFLNQKTDTKDLYGFSERSIKEEIKKAKLIKQDENAWNQRIKDAENNPLFDGYVSALFECKEIGASEDQSKFDDRVNHAKKFFINDKTQFVEVLSYLISNMDSGQANACLRVQKQKQVFYPSPSVLNTILTDDDWYPVVHELLDSGDYSKLGKGGSKRWHRLLSDKKLLNSVINHNRASSFYVNGNFFYPKRSSSCYIALDAQRRDNILTGLLNNKAISLKNGYEKIDLSNSSSLFIGPINIEFVFRNCTFRWKLEENKLAKLDNSGNEIEVYDIQLCDDSNTIKQQMDNMLAAPAATASPTTAAPAPTSTKSSTTNTIGKN